jgi:fumarate hydratase subunit alpha
VRSLHVSTIRDAVRDMAIHANTHLPADIIGAIEGAHQRERSPVGRDVLQQILDNDRIAADEAVPACQDTGLAVIFVALGQDLRLEGGDLREAINDGVRAGYEEGYLRKSVCHPFSRKNTGDNTPAIIHVDLVPGDSLELCIAPKGGGSENMSSVKMLKPSDGREGVRRYVVDWVSGAGGNPCPPTIVGVGIGGNFERSAWLAKKALLRPLGEPSPDPDLAVLEAEILEGINASGIGPMGLGGTVTAFAVHVVMEPCHIASLPLAVNLQCHAARHESVTLRGELVAPDGGEAQA